MSESQAEALKPILKELLYELLIQEKDLLKASNNHLLAQNGTLSSHVQRLEVDLVSAKSEIVSLD